MLPSPVRRFGAYLAVLAAALLAAVAVPVLSDGAYAAGPLSITVSGSRFVDQDSASVRLLGVNTPSTEYACIYGYAYGQPVADPAGAGGDAAAIADDRQTADAIAAWHANAVRIPLNEDCWLGINGQPSYGTAAGYRQAILDYVTALHQAGIYAILDLHWTDGSNVDETIQPATGFVADGQRPAPDANSVPFWRSVATVFANDPGVVFDLFNEPYSPDAIGKGPSQLTWGCLVDGGCVLPSTNQFDNPAGAPTYVNVGFQQLVDTIRSAGASQPIMLGGLSYANDLSQLLTHLPNDPLGQLAASFHNYYGEAADDTAAWDGVIAPIAAQMPVVAGEFDQGYDCQHGPTTPAALVNFDTTWMGWADAHGVSYTAWGWWILDPDPGTVGCSDVRWAQNGISPGDLYALIGADGQATTPDGIALHDHLATLVGGPPPEQLTVTTRTPHPGTESVAYAAYALKATGGTATLSWSVVGGALPTGMTLSKSGSLAGTPACAAVNPACPVASSTFTVRVTDTSKPVRTGTATLTVTVNPMSITVPFLKIGQVRVAYPSTTFKVVGGGTPVLWSATGLPPGLKMSTAGAISGTPTVDGLYDVGVDVHNTKTGNAYRSAHADVQIEIQPMEIDPTNGVPKDGWVGSAYTLAFTVTGGTATRTWSVIDGTLPPGLKMAPSNGAVSGTATTVGDYTFTVHVHDNATPQDIAEKRLTIRIWPMEITPNTVPAAQVGKWYHAALSHYGGKGTITYKIVAGVLPGGITMTSGGAISGTPKVGGMYHFTVQAKDASVPANTATRDYGLWVSG